MESEGGIAHDEYILKTSELVERLNNRFARQEGFDALIAIGNELSSLKYFYPDGRMESVKTCKAIGTGAPHGSIFLNQLWGSSMSMEQVAELGYFIIKYIEAFELDLSVGVAEGAHPQIWFLPDGFAPDGSCKVFEPNQALLDKLETNTTIRLQRYRNSLPDLYAL